MFETFDLIVSFLTLSLLEIVLGIDNVLFLTISTQRLPATQRKLASQIGLTFAWVLRLLFLTMAMWLTKLTMPILNIYSISFSIRDLFLLFGGLFLIAKATQEIHFQMEPNKRKDKKRVGGTYLNFTSVVTQIAVLDLVFSFDSVLTAIGLVKNFWLMAAAITAGILAMLFMSTPLGKLVEKHPTIKMLALSFLYLIGMALIADAFQFHIPRSYLYFAIGFSIFVEILNFAHRKRTNQ